MRVKFRIFGKVNFIGIKTSRQLTCFYIRSLNFLFKLSLEYAKNQIHYAYFSEILILLIFEFGW